MPLEVRILTGARAGQVERFEKAVVVVGRHAVSDLRFDPEKDLDVSGRHGELRANGEKYSVFDAGSTNGTFVNGTRVHGTFDLSDGDRVRFGSSGPEVEVRLLPATTGQRAPVRPTSKNTEQRIAIAVKQQTAGLKRFLYAAVVILGLGVAAAFLYGRQQSAQRVEELRHLLAMNDSVAAILQGGIGRAGDTALLNAVETKIRELRRRLPAATTDAERDQIAQEIELNERQLRRMVQMDLPTIHARNAPAVAILVSEINGVAFAGSGFSINEQGVLVTNRHNVRNERGEMASRIAVKFTNTRDWLPARVVKVSDLPDVDLAIIQVERPGPYPAVESVVTDGGGLTEGVSVVTIGFPLGYDTPMEGEGNDFLAKSSLNPGTVSKKTSSVLQIDSYAAHGSSGSPVFNGRGRVVGVVWGGPPGGGGRIVYAVPPERVAEFLGAELRALVRE